MDSAGKARTTNAPLLQVRALRAQTERGWTVSRDEIETFDLKAVNLDQKSEGDTRTSEQLLDLIEEKVREVSAQFRGFAPRFANSDGVPLSHDLTPFPFPGKEAGAN